MRLDSIKMNRTVARQGRVIVPPNSTAVVIGIIFSISIFGQCRRRWRAAEFKIHTRAAGKNMEGERGQLQRPHTRNTSM
jgi:hypothetical protein